MAFLLKSTKFIPDLIGLARQRGVLGRTKKRFFLENPNIFVCNEFRARTAVSLALKDNLNKKEEFDKTIFQLNKDVQSKNIFMENVREVFENLKQGGEITNPQLMLLLKCCGQTTFMSPCNERIQMVEEIWKTAIDLGTQFHISHYNMLLAVFLENNHKFSPSEFLETLKKEGLEPSLLTYKRILKAYCQQGDINGANSVLKEMKKLNYPLTEEDFNALIECHCNMGDLEKAADIITVMKERDIDPTSKSYIYVLCGYAKTGEIDKLKAILKELPEKDVYLSDSNFLEIIYTMAANGHFDHIDMILQNLGHNSDTLLLAARTIQRLLHDRLDSVAIKIFEKIHEQQGMNDQIRDQSRHILRHFLLYRSPNETLDLCNKFEERGWNKTALGFVLKECFHQKNELVSIDFLEAMKVRNMEIRSHYFWPAIIKASKKGKSEMMEILRAMPRDLIANCNITTTKVIFPNYNFAENWREDYETLRKVGVGKLRLSSLLLERLLAEQKYEDAEVLASTLPLDRLNVIVNDLVKCLSTDLTKDNFFVNIIYCLAHDFTIYSRQIRTAPPDVNEEKTNLHLFDLAVISLIEILRDETVVLRVLEGMLARKMGITRETGALVTSSFPSQSVSDIVTKLTDPGLQFKLDENMYKKKNGKNYEVGNQNLPDCLKLLTSDVEANTTLLLKEMRCEATLDNCLNFIRQVIMDERYAESVKLIEKLGEREDINIGPKSRKLYLTVLSDLCKSKGMDLPKKAFHLGVDLGIIKNDDYILVLRQFLSRGDFSEALDMYLEFIKKNRRVVGGMEFLKRAVAEGDEEAVKKLYAALLQFLPEYVVQSHLCLAYAADGQLKKAKKLAESTKLNFTEKQFYTHCQIVYGQTTSKSLEYYLALVKDQELFDRIPLYKLLLKKYAEEGNVEGAKQLWLMMEEDDISNYGFLELMREFMNDPKLENLHALVATFDCDDYSTVFDSESFKKLINNKQYDKAVKMALLKKAGSQEVRELMKLLVAEGKTAEVLEILNKHPFPIDVKVVAVTFLQENKLSEYLEFLTVFTINGQYRLIAECFNVGRCLESLESNDSQFEQYKSLAIQCFQEGKIVLPLNGCFVTCLRMAGRVKDAEELFESYSDHFKNLPFSNIFALTKQFLQLPVCENLISSQKLKSHYSKFLPLIYSQIISAKCDENEVQNALDILNMAMTEGIGKHLKSTAIKKLKTKLEGKGETFPYPELLHSQS